MAGVWTEQIRLFQRTSGEFLRAANTVLQSLRPETDALSNDRVINKSLVVFGERIIHLVSSNMNKYARFLVFTNDTYG